MQKRLTPVPCLQEPHSPGSQASWLEPSPWLPVPPLLGWVGPVPALVLGVWATDPSFLPALPLSPFSAGLCLGTPPLPDSLSPLLGLQPSRPALPPPPSSFCLLPLSSSSSLSLSLSSNLSSSLPAPRPPILSLLPAHCHCPSISGQKLEGTLEKLYFL